MPANTNAARHPRKKGRARLIVIVLVLALVGGCRLRRVLERQHRARLLPADHGLAQAQGPVGDPVDVKRDGDGIPQIYADTPTRTCSWRRATSRRRTGSTRWTSAAT